jgi:hypothetical protein
VSDADGLTEAVPDAVVEMLGVDDSVREFVREPELD